MDLRPKRNYQNYTHLQKVEALKYASKYGIMNACRNLNISRNTIRRWRNRGPENYSAICALEPSKEKILIDWIKQNLIVNGKIPKKNKEKIGELALNLSNKPDFRASESWINKFLRTRKEFIFNDIK